MSMNMRSSPNVIVYIDGFCPYCRATARIIQRLDLLQWIQVVSYRHDASYRTFAITLDVINEAMHAVRLRGGVPKVLRGYAAVIEVVKHLPLLWAFLPVLWLVGRVGLGERAYRWLAANRVLVPDSRRCDQGACRVK